MKKVQKNIHLTSRNRNIPVFTFCLSYYQNTDTAIYEASVKTKIDTMCYVMKTYNAHVHEPNFNVYE